MQDSCRWKSRRGEACHRRSFEKREYCVFHLPRKTHEQAEEFEGALPKDVEEQQRKHPKRLDFTGFHFPTRVLLTELLRPTLVARRRTVVQEVDFSEAWFDDEVKGDRLVLQGSARLDATTFRGPLSFEKATFQGRTSFVGAIFQAAATFSSATFLQDVSFEGAAFQEEVSFSKATFQRVAWFAAAIFQEDASFSGTTFQRDASFGMVNFQAAVHFDDAAFQEGAWFGKAGFRGDSSFEGVTCQGVISFDDAVFLERLRIRPLQGRESVATVRLQRARFEGPAEFDWSALRGRTPSAILRLRECAFEGSAAVMFRGAMGCASLQRTDLSRAAFLDEDWQPREDLAGAAKPKARRAVLEEFILERMAAGDANIPAELHDVAPNRVAELYRRLRENYEDRGRYGEAGDFFVGEMEILRQYQTVQSSESTQGTGEGSSVRVLRRSLLDPYRLLLLEPYRILALYGETLLRPVLASIAIVFGFAAVRVVAGSPETALEDSIFAYFQLRGTTSLDLAERLAALPLLGLVFIGLRRKLERR